MPAIDRNICSVCGGQMTGFTTLFCPACERRKEANQQAESEALFYLNVYEILQYQPGDEIRDFHSPEELQRAGKQGALEIFEVRPQFPVWSAYFMGYNLQSHYSLYRYKLVGKVT